MKTFRKIVFWTHLAMGLIAGLSIAIMCFTGVLLAFEHEIVEWAEHSGEDAARYLRGDGVRPTDEGSQLFADLVGEAVDRCAS